MKTQILGSVAFSWRVKTIMVLTMREKRGKRTVKKREGWVAQWDASGKLFIMRCQCEDVSRSLPKPCS